MEMEHYAADGLPLRVGDVVTCAENVSEQKYAHYLTRGVVQGKRFGDVELGKPVCVVEFAESTNFPFVGNSYPCLMETLIHLGEVQGYSVPNFENMFCAMLGI